MSGSSGWFSLFWQRFARDAGRRLKGVSEQYHAAVPTSFGRRLPPPSAADIGRA